MSRFILISVIMILVVMPVYATGNHPSWGYPPNPMPEGYGTPAWGNPPELSYGVITFSAPYPDPSLLTDAEKYIIAGTSSSRKGGGFIPWQREIFNVVNGIYENTGKVPEVLTPDVLKSVMDVDYATATGAIDQFRSPITGEFPRLDASTFERGQVFIHLLTDAEMRHFAEVFPDYQSLWFDGCWTNPSTGQTMALEVAGGVFYMRIYGETDIIYEGIDCIYREIQ